MTYAYKDAVQALHALVESRMMARTVPSSTGQQVERLAMAQGEGQLPAEVLRHCKACDSWGMGETCANPQGREPACEAATEPTGAGFQGRAPRQVPTRRDWMPALYDPIGDLCAIFDQMTLEDQLVLQLEIIVPDWFNRARRCRNRTCRHVRLCEVTETGLVYDPVCPACGGRQSRPVRPKAEVIAKAMTDHRRAKYDKIKRRVRAGELPVWRLLRARGLRKAVDRRVIPTVIREALNRWRRELHARGLCP